MFAAFAQTVDDPQILVKVYGGEAALFNPELVAGYPHIQVAKVHTDRAFERGENVAREYNIEFLVRLSGRKQIEKALDMGIQKGCCIGVMAEKGVIAVMERELENRDDSLFELTGKKEVSIRDFFGVSGSGKILQKNIFEKIALISVY
jgi:tRNA threonylcarbamoyladenosine modification (KEOPS) complex Cgi121 subunit